MIQAESNYVQGTAAKKIRYDVYNENNVLKEKKKQKRNNRMKLRLVLLTGAFFSACFVIMFRYAMITELSYNIDNTYNKYNSILNENTILKADISRDTDLSAIKETAENRLGMQEPDTYQIVYVSIPKHDYTKVADDINRPAVTKKSMLSIMWDKVGSFTRLLY